MLVRSLLVGSLLTAMAAAPTMLVYSAKQGVSAPAQGGFTLLFDIAAPPELVAKLRNANVILGIEKLQIRESGRRSILSTSAQGALVRLAPDKATVTGTYQGKPFKYDFAGAPPADLAKDQVRQFAFALSMGGRNFTLGPKGEYTSGSTDDDAAAEAMAMMIDAPVRLPETAVDVGQQWTREFAGNRKHKETGAVFRYKQNATLKSLAQGRAVIAFTTSGRLDIPPEKNTEKEETTVQTSGSVTLDMKSGLVVASTSTGTLTTAFQGGAIKLTRRIDASFSE